MNKDNVLPKACYGNHSGYYCNYKCEFGSDCYSVTNTRLGSCNCEFKGCCHVPRQYGQSRHTQEPKEECWFHQQFMKDVERLGYPKILEIPDGVCDMKPIMPLDREADEENKVKPIKNYEVKVIGYEGYKNLHSLGTENKLSENLYKIDKTKHFSIAESKISDLIDLDDFKTRSSYVNILLDKGELI